MKKYRLSHIPFIVNEAPARTKADRRAEYGAYPSHSRDFVSIVDGAVCVFTRSGENSRSRAEQNVLFMESRYIKSRRQVEKEILTALL